VVRLAEHKMAVIAVMMFGALRQARKPVDHLDARAA
jgi:hypothetical protein